MFLAFNIEVKYIACVYRQINYRQKTIVNIKMCLMMNDKDKTKEQLLAEVKELKNKLIISGKIEKDLEVINRQFEINGEQLKAFNQQLKEKNQQLLVVEEALRESEARWQFAIEGNALGLWDWNVKTNDIFFSRQWKAMLGFEENEISGSYEEWDKRVHPDDKENVYADIDKHFKGETDIYINEHRVLCKDNTYKWILGRGKIISQTEDGKPLRMIGTHTDIMERKKAEKKLKQSYQVIQQERNMFVSGPVVVFKWKNAESWPVEYVSPNVKEVFGFMAEEFLSGKIPYTDLISSEDIERVANEVAVNSKSGTNSFIHQPYRVVRKDGEVIWINDYTTILRNKNGDITHYMGYIIDVTEQKKVEEVLHESEKKYRTLTENMADGVFSLDLMGCFTYVSPVIETMSGYQLQYLMGRSFTEVLSPESIELAVKNFKQGILGKKISPYEIELVCRNGTKMPLELSMTTLYDSNGQVVGRLGISRDIAERKNAEIELTKLSIAVQQSPSVIAITDLNGILEYVNPKFTELTGYTFEEAIGKHTNILRSHKQPDEIYKKQWDTITKGKKWRGEFHNVKKNGEFFWEAASVSPIFNKQGKKINYIKVAEDITERKRTEERIKDSLYQIEMINANTPSIIWKSSLDKNGNYTNTYISEVADKFLALPAGTLNNSWEKYFSYIIPKHLPEINELFKQGIASPGTLFSFDYEVKKANGEIAWLSSKGNAILNNKEIVLYGSTIDITDAKQKEVELIAAKEKAEESDRLKSAFLSNMSHEIRTPMNGIVGFVNLLDNPGLDNIKRQEYTAIINKSSDRLLNTINDLIDISKIEAGQVKILNAETSINKLLDELFAFYKPEADSKGLSLTLLPTLSNRQATIFTDNYKLYGVLANLIKNAIKFTENGGVTFGYVKNDNFVEFFVKDTGIGVSENRLEAIFRRFEQADIEDITVHEGSGLGLAIAKAYVELLGGKIWLTSKEGRGSKFLFTIPYVVKMNKKIEHPLGLTKEAHIEETFKNLCVLIAEDEEASALFLKTILENIFGKIIFAKTGKEAVEMCKDHPEIDIVLMDIKMPIMNGYEATHEIRKFNKDLIIIAQTAYALEGDREEAFKVGCDGHMSKPIKKEVLLEMIDFHMKKKK
ncbi:MAG: hypothetical protein DRJ05_07935 [Bacteroidetes bacterium]|nr:MAG: hypothetical protein DRJ05_07935 [Bacteroidota bacterium]